MKELGLFNNVATQTTIQRLVDENKQLKDENTLLKNELEYARTQVRALTDHMETSANKTLDLVRNAGS